MFPEPGCKSQDVTGRWDRLEKGKRMQGQSSEVDLVYAYRMEDSSRHFSVAVDPNHNTFGHQVFKKFQSAGPE